MSIFTDDPIFPTTPVGLEAIGVFEAAKDAETGQELISESAVPDGTALGTAKAQAMSAAIAWVAGDEFTYAALEEFVIGVCDLDGDAEIGESEEDLYNDAWKHVPNAILSLGNAKEDDVEAFINAENNDASARIGKVLRESLDDTEADDEDIIGRFAFGEGAVLESLEDEDKMVLEASFKKAKVVRNGKVQVVRKRTSGKVRMSAAQRAGLKKARRKAHSSAGKLARRKSMKMRKQRGL